MVALLILFAVILALILWIALTPLHVTVNTDLDQYQINQAGTVKITFHPWQRPHMRMWLFGFRVHTVTKEGMLPPRKGRQKKKAAIKRSVSSWLYLFQGIYHSFRLKKFVCAIDLDDPVASARLIPLVLLLNRGGVALSTNFINRNFLYMKIHVSVRRILWTTFRFYTKK